MNKKLKMVGTIFNRASFAFPYKYGCMEFIMDEKNKKLMIDFKFDYDNILKMYHSNQISYFYW